MKKLFFRVRRMLFAAIRAHASFPFLPSTHSVEDVLQELWLSIFQRNSLERFTSKGAGSLRAYLRRCLDRTMVDTCRRANAEKRGQGQRHERLDPASAGAGVHIPASPSPGPSTAVQWGDWQERCSRYLRGDEREVWKLRFVDELRYAEIARKTDISENAARSAYHRAIQKLRDVGLLDGD